jgi:hypothetical protein
LFRLFLHKFCLFFQLSIIVNIDEKRIVYHSCNIRMRTNKCSNAKKKMQFYRSNAKCNFNEMQIIMFECELIKCEMRSVRSECVRIAINFNLKWKKCLQCEDLINNVVDSLCYFNLFIWFVIF